MDSGHASHAHVCTCVYIMYILCIYVYIYMYTHTNTRVSATHPPGRSLILLRIFGWIEAKGRKWFLFLPLVPIWVTFLLRTKRLAGFSFFFFWNRAFSLVPPPDLSRYNKRGHEDFCCVPISLGRASLRNSGTRLLLCYLSLFTRSEKMARKWCSGKKYCLLSNTVIQKCFLPNCFEAIFFRIAISGKQ